MKVNINKFTGFCGCGKEHKILVKDIIIESEAIKKLPEIMEKEGFKNITIISSRYESGPRLRLSTCANFSNSILSPF